MEVIATCNQCTKHLHKQFKRWQDSCRLGLGPLIWDRLNRIRAPAAIVTSKIIFYLNFTFEQCNSSLAATAVCQTTAGCRHNHYADFVRSRLMLTLRNKYTVLVSALVVPGLTVEILIDWWVKYYWILNKQLAGHKLKIKPAGLVI